MLSRLRVGQGPMAAVEPPNDCGDRPRTAFSYRLENMPLVLPAPLGGSGGALRFHFLLPFRDIGETLAKSLVLHYRRLIDLSQFVEGTIGQFTALVSDCNPAIRIVVNGNALAGEGA
jgi:hypothetical protein